MGSHLDTIESAASSSGRSSVSLDFGAPLMQTVQMAAAESGILLSSTSNVNNRAESMASLSIDQAIMTTYHHHHNYHEEEKPPAYEDIIKNQS